MRIPLQLLLLAALSVYQGSARGAAEPAPAPQVVDNSHVAVLSADQVVQILDDAVEWYRTLGTQQQNANQPSELLIVYANQQTASQVVALAFEIARANAELLSSEANNAPATGNAKAAGAAASSVEALATLQNKLQAQRQTVQTEIDAARRQLGTAKGGDQDLDAKLSELQGELAMIDARKNLLDTMSQFVNESDANRANASALKAHIDAIAASIPSQGVGSGLASSSSSSSSSPGASAPTQYAGGVSSNRSGIWDMAANVFRLSAKIDAIKAIDVRTAALQKTFLKIRTAPLEQLKRLSAQGDALATQADSAGGATLKTIRDQFDTLAWFFKQTSAILIPLSKEGVLLQQYRQNLSSWHDATEHQYHDALIALGIRLGILALLLAAVFAGGELWHRLVFKYAREPRRRYQLLLVRKITVWTLAVIIVGLTFVTELSSFATFAGLITAGVAVAMQSVLVSIVGYFFLIGKYGVRVGDRVQIGNVTGEVIDLGLVRMHLMELTSNGPLGATGRVVAFANSIVFQASGGLFRQIPGVNFAWHETTLKLPAGSDYSALKEQLRLAVSDVLKEYQDEIVRQTKQIQQTTSAGSVGSATPQVQLHFFDGGVEALIRYPVQLQHAAEIDEHVSKELAAVVSSSAGGAPSQAR